MTDVGCRRSSSRSRASDVLIDKDQSQSQSRQLSVAAVASYPLLFPLHLRLLHRRSAAWA